MFDKTDYHYMRRYDDRKQIVVMFTILFVLLMVITAVAYLPFLGFVGMVLLLIGAFYWAIYEAFSI
jgi:hypothetical protein